MTASEPFAFKPLYRALPKMDAYEVEVLPIIFRSTKCFYVSYRDDDEGRKIEMRGQLFVSVKDAERWIYNNMNVEGEVVVKDRRS